MKIPVVLYQRSMVDATFFGWCDFFSCDCGDQKSFKKIHKQQRNGNHHGIDIIYRTVLSAGLRLSTSISQYEVGIIASHYLFYMESHMPLASAIAIGAFQ